MENRHLYTEKKKSKTEHTKPKKSMLKLSEKEPTNQKTRQLKQRKPHRRHINLKENTENLSENTKSKDEHKTLRQLEHTEPKGENMENMSTQNAQRTQNT